MTTKQPGTDFPFAGNVLESLELMKKVWGGGFAQMPGFPMPTSMGQSLPSMMVPTLDVDELDKRIGDLRAVEQWLGLNASMLRATIQALEVQRNTIATLKSLSTAMMTAPQATPVPPTPAAGESPAPAPGASRRPRRPPASETPAPNMAEMPLNPAAWWGNLQDQFTRIATAAAGGTAPLPAQPKDNKPSARKPPPKRAA